MYQTSVAFIATRARSHTRAHAYARGQWRTEVLVYPWPNPLSRKNSLIVLNF